MQTCFVRLLRLYASSCLPRFARFSPAGGGKKEATLRKPWPAHSVSNYFGIVSLVCTLFAVAEAGVVLFSTVTSLLAMSAVFSTAIPFVPVSVTAPRLTFLVAG